MCPDEIGFYHIITLYSTSSCLHTHTNRCGRVSVGILCTQSENQLSSRSPRHFSNISGSQREAHTDCLRCSWCWFFRLWHAMVKRGNSGWAGCFWHDQQARKRSRVVVDCSYTSCVVKVIWLTLIHLNVAVGDWAMRWHLHHSAPALKTSVEAHKENSTLSWATADFHRRWVMPLVESHNGL